MPDSWFEDFDVVVVDEVHLAKAKSISSILEKMVNTKYRFGFTGTLDDVQVHQLVIEGLLGPVKQFIRTKELIDKQYLADLQIKCIMLKYSDETRKYLAAKKNSDYQKEIDFIVSNEKRNDFIVKLALSLKGNTLILFNTIEHGENIFRKIKHRIVTGKQ